MRLSTITISQTTISPQIVHREGGYIAGVTNPIFEASGNWDLLCDVSTGRMVVSRDIHANYPAAPINMQSQLLIRTGTIRAENGLALDEDIVRTSRDAGVTAPRPDFMAAGKADGSPDIIFIEDVSADDDDPA